MDERAFASATRLAGEIRDRRIGCLELLDFFVARAEQYNPALNAIVAWQLTGLANVPAPLMPRWPAARYGGRCTACR
jgi:Asp-tRNA(Asn)/Glu-tRNA(Gln) amidotransferase A subunit family amidase